MWIVNYNPSQFNEDLNWVELTEPDFINIYNIKPTPEQVFEFLQPELHDYFDCPIDFDDLNEEERAKELENPTPPIVFRFEVTEDNENCFLIFDDVDRYPVACFWIKEIASGILDSIV